MFFDYWKIPLLSLPEMRNMVSQKTDGKTIFTDCWKVLDLNYLKMGNTVYFWQKSWWKNHIQWLLESPCFEPFGDGKHSLFWAKKLMERWYFLGLFEIFMIFQDLENMGSCAAISMERQVVTIISTFRGAIYHWWYHCWWKPHWLSQVGIVVINFGCLYSLIQPY